METIDLVLCEHDLNKGKKFLFQAPMFSYLEKGDKVVVDTKYGEQVATVLASCSVGKGTEQYTMIVQACGATEPIKKVISKITYRKFEYSDEGESEHE